MGFKWIPRPRCSKCGRSMCREKDGVYKCYICKEWLITMEEEADDD